jgi:hypothetical protein
MVYLKNQSLTQAVQDLTPYKAWYGRQPDLSHVKVIGTLAYIYVPKKKRIKLSFKLDACFLDMEEGINIWYGT